MACFKYWKTLSDLTLDVHNEIPDDQTIQQFILIIYLKNWSWRFLGPKGFILLNFVESHKRLFKQLCSSFCDIWHNAYSLVFCEFIFICQLMTMYSQLTWWNSLLDGSWDRSRKSFHQSQESQDRDLGQIHLRVRDFDQTILRHTLLVTISKDKSQIHSYPDYLCII